MKTAALRLSVDENILKTDLFEKDDFRARVLLNHEPKMTADCCVSKFIPRSVGGKHFLPFQSETSVFKFPWRSVGGKHLMRFQTETTFLNSSVVVWTRNI